MPDIDEMKDEVKDEVEATEPETEDEATEQRSDDYDGLARRLDDVLAKLDGITDAVARVESMYTAFVDAGAVVHDSPDDVSEAVVEETGFNDMADGEGVAVDIDELDLSL